MITLVIVLGVVYTYMELQLPNVDVLKDVHMQVPLRVYTRNGKLITQYGTKRRIPVTLQQIPKQLVKAVLAVEDARYYSHPGVDFVSLVRAAKAVIKTGRKVQGASTITMQVARNFFLTRKKTYIRKVKEILLALKIDKELSKDKVLELYLNKVYFGNRAYGVAAAAQVYYGKRLNQLTLAQIAMIAGLPQAPSRNNPLRRPRAAIKRRNHVLKRMYEVGYITKKMYQKAIRAPITASYHGLRSQIRAPYIAEMVRQVMVSEYGKRAYEMGLKVYTTISAKLQIGANHALHKGLIAYSERHGYRGPVQYLGVPNIKLLPKWQTILRKMPNVDQLLPAIVLIDKQQSVQALVATGDVIRIPWSGLAWARPALRHGWVGRKPEKASDVVKPGDLIWVSRDKKGRWQLNQTPQVQGALISLNPQDGAVLALTGGFDYSLSNFNRVTQAQRQPGSNFKPFIYSAALAKGYTLASVINDAPVVIRDTGENRYWRPRNDTLKFYGPTRLRVGLTQSRNLVSIRLLQAIGVPYALNYIRRFGFDPTRLPHSLSLALGSGTVTPVQIALGYSVFANGGYRIVPYFIQKIEENNKIVFQADPTYACEICITQAHPPEDKIPTSMAPQVLTPQNAYLITKALQGVIQTGTGRGARILKRTDIAGKTGTTNDKVDAWFSGFNNNIETTVWVGFDNLKPLHEYGSQAALPIWIDYMRVALRGTPEKTMPQPPKMVTVRIDPKNGMLANPGQANAIFEEFRKKHEPRAFSQNRISTHSQIQSNSPHSDTTTNDMGSDELF